MTKFKRRYLQKGSGAYHYRQPKVFRRYDDGYIVREMLPGDARITQNWFCSLGKISPYDLNTILNVFPPGVGCYMGEMDGQVIASAVQVPWSEDVFYGSLYYVAEGHRRQGYGTRLRDEVARGYIGDNVLCIDAIMGKVEYNNKTKFGYTKAFKTSRYEGVAKACSDFEIDGLKIVQASEVPFDDIMDYDNKCFISPDSPTRRHFLSQWLYLKDGASYVALDSSGHVVGYAQRRPCFQEGSFVVGPLYADSGEIACSIIQKIYSEIPGDLLTIDIWEPNEEAVKVVNRCGMRKVFDLSRMHLNGDPKEYKDTVFGLTSIEVCGF